MKLNVVAADKATGKGRFPENFRRCQTWPIQNLLTNLLSGTNILFGVQNVGGSEDQPTREVGVSGVVRSGGSPWLGFESGTSQVWPGVFCEP